LRLEPSMFLRCFWWMTIPQWAERLSVYKTAQPR
jgi:hypothetical protein